MHGRSHFPPVSLTHTDNIAKKWLWITVAASHHGSWSHCFNFPTRGILIIYDFFHLSRGRYSSLPFYWDWNYKKNMPDELLGAAWRERTVEISSSEVVTSTQQIRHSSTREAVLMLDSLTCWLEVPLISCSHFFSFFLCLSCVNKPSIFQSECKEK